MVKPEVGRKKAFELRSLGSLLPSVLLPPVLITGQVITRPPADTIPIHRATRTEPGAAATPTSGLIHSNDSQIDRSSSSSRHESRNCRERHPRGPPST